LTPEDDVVHDLPLSPDLEKVRQGVFPGPVGFFDGHAKELSAAMFNRNLGTACFADGLGWNSLLPGQFAQPVEVLPPASHEYPGLGLTEK
jgi:hypothetical protein